MEVFSMAGTNRTLVPEARYALDQFKVEIASEVGIQSYETIDKGNLTSRQNGTVGGNMVRRMVESYERGISGTTTGWTGR
jgi:small acid-soluble spore protein A (major alpha-type SASP)